jgi:hypothetical protein
LSLKNKHKKQQDKTAKYENIDDGRNMKNCMFTVKVIFFSCSLSTTNNINHFVIK